MAISFRSQILEIPFSPLINCKSGNQTIGNLFNMMKQSLIEFPSLHNAFLYAMISKRCSDPLKNNDKSGCLSCGCLGHFLFVIYFNNVRRGCRIVSSKKTFLRRSIKLYLLLLIQVEAGHIHGNRGTQTFQ